MRRRRRFRGSFPPSSKSALARIVSKYADTEQIAIKRVMRWISFIIVTWALDRLRPARGNPVFSIKGGLTFEMRLRLRARATKDLAASFWHSERTLLDALDDAVRIPYGRWTFSRDGEPRDIGKATQVFVRLHFAGKSWSTVQLEISNAAVEGENDDMLPAIDISTFGLDDI